jgi:uncharacterized protein YndB with AHSA1/START domain
MSNKTKTAFRMQYDVAINIRATPEKIWRLLTDAAGLPRWNTTVTSVDGTIALGERLALRVPLAPGRTFKPKVAVFDPGKTMVWQEGNPMFKGVRTFTLASRADGSTDFAMTEVYTGLMLPMIAGSLPDFGPAFDTYAADLKREAERA